MTANESEIGGTPGCNYSDVETETHTHKEGPQVRHWFRGAWPRIMVWLLSVPHWVHFIAFVSNLSLQKWIATRRSWYPLQKAPVCGPRQWNAIRGRQERSHTIILPHAPLNQCCFSQTGDLLASKYSTASLPRIQVQWNNQLWFRGEGFLYGAGYFLCCREKHAKRMDQWQRLL